MIPVFVHAFRDVIGSEGAGNSQKQKLQSEVPSWADPRKLTHYLGNTRLGLIVNKIPSAVPKHQLLGIPHIGINLTVFEESVRIEDVCIGIHRFVAEHHPVNTQPTVRRSPQNRVRTMCCP